MVMEKEEKEQEQGQNGGAAIAPTNLLVCAICGTSELHPEMARVPSFQTISKKIGRRVTAEDLDDQAFCKRHEKVMREESEEGGAYV